MAKKKHSLKSIVLQWIMAATGVLAALHAVPGNVWAQHPHGRVPQERSSAADADRSKAINLDDELAKDQPADRAAAYYHFAIARLYESSDDVERAISELREAVKFDWESSRLRSEFATTLFRAGSFAEAVAEVRKAVALDKNNADAHYLLGFFTLRMAGANSQKQINEAIREFEEVIRIDPEDSRGYLSLGQIYISQKDYETAIKYLEKYLSLAGDSPEGFYLLATAYEAAGKKGQAIENLKKLLAINPGLDRATNMLIDLYARSNDVDNLIDLLRKAVAAEKSNPVRRKQLATVLLNARRYDEASAELLSQIEADENNALAYVQLGRAYAGLRQIDKAHEAFVKARQIESDDKEVLYYLSLAYEEIGESEKAVEQLKSLFDGTTKMSGIYTPQEREERLTYLRQMGVIELRMGDPTKAVVTLSRLTDLSDNPRDFELLVTAYRNGKDYEKALASSEEAIKKFPEDKYLKHQKALTLAQRGQAGPAAALIDALIERDPKDLENYTTLCEVYIQSKDFDKAEKTILKAATIDTANDSLRFRLATVYERSKAYDKAETLFLDLLQKNPKNAETLNYLGYMLADRGVKLEKALDYVKKAVELDPNNGAYLDSLGWAYFKLNQLNLAEENLRRAVSRLKNDPTIHEHLGDLYFKTGDLNRAEEAWQKAVANGNEAEEIAKVKTKLQNLKKR
ncbi:MAG: tetratricopeptide repeat protein [Acidobacteria bacterium]|nr:tetratricopeptide repeat protein [Acidobacteriota bacterium]MBI3655533.1 tetratricopeptide repeat protein [Acidobacteriota bacterium]